MKPAPLDYARAASIQDAVRLLSESDLDARIINGGQSLIPMLNLRLASAELLIDISRIAELTEIRESGDHIVIGAAVKHNNIYKSALLDQKLPLLTEAYAHVAHHSVRNRGTLGGSLCHADPAAEMPMIMSVLEATFTVAGPQGRREIHVDDFFRGAFETALAENELLVAINIPLPPLGHGTAFAEVSQRHGDFALAAVACLAVMENGTCTDIRVGYRGMGDETFRISDAEGLLKGSQPNSGLIDEMARTARSAAQPNKDMHADEDYRRDLAETLTRRVVTKAISRCCV